MHTASFTTRRGFLKTLAIGAGGYAVGSLLIQPKAAFTQSIEGNLAKIPMETRWAITSGGFVYNQISIDKALLDKVGQEKYNEIKRENGLASGARNKKRAEDFGFTGNDAKSVAAMATALVTMYYGPKEKFEIVNGTAEKALVRNLNCAYWDTLQAQKITDDTCSVFSQSWWEGFATAMNPNLTLKLVKARPWGDSVCEWALTLKA
ncbi:MAG: twin-arginine translocation signal domain-containing protein [Candidatus Hermodarchaeota archaeon]